MKAVKPGSMIQDSPLLPSQTLTLARDYAAAVNKPFPEIDEKILEERDWPKDCYVFEGKDKEPTIVYMPLFNRNNCKGLLQQKQKYSEHLTNIAITH